MIFVPLPFLVTLLCAIFVARSLAAARSTGERSPLVGSLVAYGLLAFLIGLRWGYGIATLAALQPILAAAALALTVSAFRAWAGLRSGRELRYLDIALPPLGVVLVQQVLPQAVGPTVIGLFVTAGTILGRLSLQGADALPRAGFDEATLIHRSLRATAIFFLLSAGIDLAIDLDFQWTGGLHAPRIVALANLPVLLALCFAAASTGRPPPCEAPAEPSRPRQEVDIGGSGNEDTAILATLDAAMAERTLYRDPELTLERLARKLVVPGRQISRAINNLRDQNVSQYVNAYRVAEAQELLDVTNRPITRIMFDCGFQTKSNFNREFRRLAGCSPSDWRTRSRGPAGTTDDMPSGPVA